MGRLAGWDAAGAGASLSGLAQDAQKRASARFGSPHAGQVDASGAAHWSQNLLPVRFSAPHAVQIIGPPLVVASRRVPDEGAVAAGIYLGR